MRNIKHITKGYNTFLYRILYSGADLSVILGNLGTGTTFFMGFLINWSFEPSSNDKKGMNSNSEGQVIQKKWDC